MVWIKKGRILGMILMVLSFAFIVRELLTFDLNNIQFERPVSAILMIFLLCCAAVASIFIAAYAWRVILMAIHGSLVPFSEVFKVYVKSNAAKYLPGNVLHYAGRNMLGSRKGWKHGDILLSSFLEIILILLSAFIFLLIFSYASLVDILIQAYENLLNHLYLAIGGGIFLITLCIVTGWVYRKKLALMDRLRMVFSIRFLKILGKNLFLYGATFAILGLTLSLILSRVLGLEVAGLKNVLLIVSASVLSWFAGFITPGAPGGIGIREAVLVMLLSPVYGREGTLAAALIHRLISVLGDAGAFGLGLLMEKGIIPLKSKE